MYKSLRKILILLAIFLGALFGFFRLTNHETSDVTADMAQAALPVVYMIEDGRAVNEMHGYVDEMDAGSMRDTVTPLADSGILTVRVDSYGQEIENISFEVRSLDAQRLIQDSPAAGMRVSKDATEAQLKVEDLLEYGQEYILMIQVKAAGIPYRYYTRIIREDDSHVQECLDFVEEFHEITMNKERRSELLSYMETSPDEDNTTLQKVTINSSLTQACWADFEGVEVTEPAASIKEINDSYNVILLNYILSSVNEEGESEYYNVEEYYRVRKGRERMYLLSFERTVEEIFRGESSHIQADRICLGIRSEEVDFQANETGNIVCFVQQGELWSYNQDQNELTQIFSFRSLEGMDVRENYGEHDIHIIRTDESGNVDFIVCGYMNRGDHEGQVGISVCRYDSVTTTVREQLFLPFHISYQMMKEEAGRFMYLSDSDVFYLAVGDQMHRIDLDTMEDEVVISGLADGTCAGSDDGRYFAWLEDGAPVSATMHLTDLETGETSDIAADAGCVVRPLGFIGTDCIYGQAAEERMAGIDSGGQEPAFEKVLIVDSAGSGHQVQKTYEEPGVYVTGLAIREGNIYLDRVTEDSGVFRPAAQDTIMNRDMQGKAPVYIAGITSEIKQREVILHLAENVSELPQNLLIPKQILVEETAMEILKADPSHAYYVYAKGKILLATDHVAEAVRSADENKGVVIGKNQTYVWKRGKKQEQQPLYIAQPQGNSSEAKAVSAMLSEAGISADADALLASGKSPYEVLKENIPGRAVYDLTGCGMEQTLYFVGTGSPVYARRADGSVALLTGYNDTSVWIYDTASGETKVGKIEEASEQFAQGGNVFYAIGE